MPPFDILGRGDVKRYYNARICDGRSAYGYSDARLYTDKVSDHERSMHANPSMRAQRIHPMGPTEEGEP